MKVEATVENCEECSGTGKISYERPEPWLCRDSPPSLEEVTEDCEECGGLGTVQIINLDSEEKMLTTITDKRPTLKEAQDIVGGYVEMVIDTDLMQLMVDEEGLLKNLPFNPEASKMADRHIVGNALVLKGSAMWTHESEAFVWSKGDCDADSASYSWTGSAWTSIQQNDNQEILKKDAEMLDGVFKKVFKDKW
tara:strand:- start:1149 stop:1730 length:582 start_codon:yes stop_codon:yes gene_type:complete